MSLLKHVKALANTELRQLPGERLAIAAAIALFLSVAFWNGFPLIFYDTGAYVVEGLGGHFFVERSPVYSLFLAAGGAKLSLWIIVIVQAFATAFVVVECARAVAPGTRVSFFFALCAGLVIATGLPWYVGEVEPDCFAPLVVLSIFLLGFHAEHLGRLRTGILLVIASLAIAAHASHLLLAAGLWLVLAAYAVICSLLKRAPGLPRARLLQPFATIGMAVALLVVSNFAFTGQIFLSRAGANFLFARLLQDRVVVRLLNETCPQSGYRLCAYREILPPTANAWLWASYSPFFKLGGYEGTRAESERIAIDSLKRYPYWNAELVVADAATQFISFKTGDQVEPQQWALRSAFEALLPNQLKSYLDARQQRGELDFGLVNWLHIPVGYLSLVMLLGTLTWCAMRKRRDIVILLSLVLIGLVGNALICGALSNPHDRYQSRLIWLMPFAVSLAVSSTASIKSDVGQFLKRLKRRRSTLPQQVESGT